VTPDEGVSGVFSVVKESRPLNADAGFDVAATLLFFSEDVLASRRKMEILLKTRDAGENLSGDC
jgi:hypothetical protein